MKVFLNLIYIKFKIILSDRFFILFFIFNFFFSLFIKYFINLTDVYFLNVLYILHCFLFYLSYLNVNISKFYNFYNLNRLNYNKVASDLLFLLSYFLTNITFILLILLINNVKLNITILIKYFNIALVIFLFQEKISLNKKQNKILTSVILFLNSILFV